MKKLLLPSLFILFLSLISCQGGKNARAGKIETVSVESFAQKLNDSSAVQLLDVRTHEEFEEGHLEGAINYNVKDANFENQIVALDKNKAVMVYCHSGHRSANAAEILESKGFSKIYNLDGGIMKWNAADKKTVRSSNEPVSDGMSLEEFNKLIQSDKAVLVDYRAKWCKPCIKMAPMLESIAKQRADKMILLPIDSDQNPKLIKAKGIESVPVLQLYQKGQLVWSHYGVIVEATLLNETKL